MNWRDWLESLRDRWLDGPERPGSGLSGFWFDCRDWLARRCSTLAFSANSRSGAAAVLNRIRLALGFMTRLPVGQQLDYSPDLMHRSLPWFPLAGWVQALLLISLWALLQPLLGTPVTLVLMLISSLLLTGSLHEDGLADCFDGFYGGFDAERKLTIMKDSRLGTYGSGALLMSLMLRFCLWLELAAQGQLLLALLVACPWSRALAITHAQDLHYVSSHNSKSDPLARPMTRPMLAHLLGLGAIGLLLLPWPVLLVVLVASALWRQFLKRWMYRHIGGFTGDSLGAAQQLQELMILTLLLAASTTGWLPAGGAW